MSGEEVTRNAIDDYVIQVVANEALIRETRIRALLQPKPRFLPVWLYHRIIRRLLVIQERSL